MSRTPKKPDRRAGARRRADKLAAQLEAQRLDRLGASASIGMGPLWFDGSLARRHGWTNMEIARFWESIAASYQRISRKMRKRYPDRYYLRDPKVPIYIGPDENGNTMGDDA